MVRLLPQVDEMRHEGHVLPVTNLLAHVAVVERILNQARRPADEPVGRLVQQRRLDGKTVWPSELVPLGNNTTSESVATRSRISLLSGRLACAARDGQTPFRQLLQPAKYRPIFHFAFATNTHGASAARQEFEITQVIADSKPLEGIFAVKLCFDPKPGAHGGMSFAATLRAPWQRISPQNMQCKS